MNMKQIILSLTGKNAINNFNISLKKIYFFPFTTFGHICCMTVCRSSRETILLFFCFFLFFRFSRFFCTSTRTSLIHKDMKTSIILLLLYYLSPTHSTADFRLFRLGMESATNKTNLDSIEYMKKLFLLLFEV